MITIAVPRLDVGVSMRFQRQGAHDPTATCEPHRFTKLQLVDGRVVRHVITWRASELRIEVENGDPELWSRSLPLDDGAFVPQREHLVLRHAVREFAGLRLLSVPWRFDLACGFVLQQRVTFGEAAMQWSRILDKWGVRSELGTAFPGARALARLQAFELQALGIDPRRAGTLIRLAREEAVHQLFSIVDRAALRARMLSISGIGPWTTEMTLGFGDGDPDAVPIGDLHLPELVGSALAREPRCTDDRMLELLEPYRGQRHRVIRLLWAVQFGRRDLLGRR